MQTPPEDQSDAAFWAALSRDLQGQPGRDDPALEFVGMETTDEVFHATPPVRDPAVDPEFLPTWGEVFTG